MARTTHRSSTGSKLYAVRDEEGKFEDIQSYKRAHGSAVQRKSKAEVATRKKVAQKKVAKKKAPARKRAATKK